MIAPKFRAWHKELKIMMEVDCIYGLSEKSTSIPQVSCFTKDGYFGIDLNLLELMQWTGLQDKNGKDIYEGDILKLNLSAEYLYLEVVRYRQDIAAFRGYYKVTQYSSGYEDDSLDATIEYEIIGNIYEDSDKLNETT